jgi:hypothetical protein
MAESCREKGGNSLVLILFTPNTLSEAVPFCSFAEWLGEVLCGGGLCSESLDVT